MTRSTTNFLMYPRMTKNLNVEKNKVVKERQTSIQLNLSENFSSSERYLDTTSLDLLEYSVSAEQSFDK